MMRYQSVSPDCLPLPNGKKPTTTTSLKVYKEENHHNHHHLVTDRVVADLSTYEPKPLKVLKPRTTDPSTSQDHNFPHFSVASPEPTGSAGSGDVLLQWGQNKRSRGSRAENRTAGDDPFRHSGKIQRRSVSGRDKDKHVATAAAASVMPPPSGGGYTRGANLRPFVQANRNIEDRSIGHHRPEKRSPQSPPQKMHRSTANGTSSAQPDATNPSSTPSSEQEAGGGGGLSAATTTTKPEKLNLAAFEWPRIFISLSRKEKEEDFYAMKGTKLPHRPKKRAKNVDKTLQYCFPGLWLSDLTRGRYDVREKKCVKRKKRGLKAMEVDSDSE